jgi:uncharacterized protein YndB with AHSA1/START domain
MTQQSNNRVQVSTPSDLEFSMARTFDAPRHLVYQAWTTPDLLKRWLGRESDDLIVCDVDLQVGGSYRFVWRMREGGEMGMGGTYREVVPNERVVATEKFDPPYEDVMGGEVVTTITFVESDGKTTFTSTTRYPTKEARDGAIATGMADGAGESFDRMEELLRTLT